MSALILDEEGFESIDPSHPLGGKDGGADALTLKAGDPWVMAVYFPRGQQSLKDITAKLVSDVEKAKSKDPRPAGVAFVTNQELRLAEREELVRAGGDTAVELYHLERITSILDRPHMAGVREQFLGIPAGPPPILVTAEVIGVARKFERSSELLDLLVESEGDSLREHNNYVRNNPENPTAFRHVASIMNALGYERPSEPPVLIPDEEVEQRVAEFRRELESRWTVCQDYLSSIAWPALRFSCH